MPSNFWTIALATVARIPFERFFLKPPEVKSPLERFVEDRGMKPEELQATATKSPAPVATPVKQKPRYNVSTAETMEYQDREIGKELLLLEKHLAQLCSINGKPCDCCEKHPMAIEALAQESLGISGARKYDEIVTWARSIAPLTTHAAAVSGEYREKYPEIAGQARMLRKKLMGTDDVTALLGAEQKESVKATVSKIMAKARLQGAEATATVAEEEATDGDEP